MLGCLKKIIIVGSMCCVMSGYSSSGESLEGDLFDIGTELSYIRYEEPGSIEEKGLMYGIFGVFTYRSMDDQKVDSLGDHIMVRADAKVSFGSVDYTSSGTGSIDNIFDFMFETRGVAGFDFFLGEYAVLTPYAGLGYRYLSDDSSGEVSTTGFSGYGRESNYLYVPLGIDVVKSLDEEWSVGLNVEYDLFLQGTQKSHLDDIDPSLNSVKNDQDKGMGIRGSIKIVKKTDSFDFTFEPFIRYWNVDNSNISIVTCDGIPCAAGYEPKNNSMEYGVKFGMRF